MHDLAVRRLSFRELRGRFNGTLVRYRSVKWRLMVYTSFDVTSMGEGCDEVAMFVGGLLFRWWIEKRIKVSFRFRLSRCRNVK